MIEVLKALNKWERREFDYGSVDCCQFAGFVVQELTGKDYLTDFDYNSEAAAEKIIASNGDLIATASTVLGQSTSDIESLPDGSPVIVDMEGRQAMGVKLASEAVCLLKKGLARVHRQHIIRGWNVWLTS